VLTFASEANSKFLEREGDSFGVKGTASQQATFGRMLKEYDQCDFATHMYALKRYLEQQDCPDKVKDLLDKVDRDVRSHRIGKRMSQPTLLNMFGAS